MTETEAKAIAREWLWEKSGRHGAPLRFQVDSLAALILSVDARARESAALLCDELQEDMADADKCAAAIRAGQTP